MVMAVVLVVVIVLVMVVNVSWFVFIIFLLVYFLSLFVFIIFYRYYLSFFYFIVFFLPRLYCSIEVATFKIFFFVFLYNLCNRSLHHLTFLLFSSIHQTNSFHFSFLYCITFLPISFSSIHETKTCLISFLCITFPFYTYLFPDSLNKNLSRFSFFITSLSFPIPFPQFIPKKKKTHLTFLSSFTSPSFPPHSRSFKHKLISLFLHLLHHLPSFPFSPTF